MRGAKARADADGPADVLAGRLADLGGVWRTLRLCWLVLVLTSWTLAAQAQPAAAAARPQAQAQAPNSVASCNSAIPVTQARRIVRQGSAILADGLVALPDKLPLQWRQQQVQVQYEIDVSACAGSQSAAISLYRVGAPYTVRAGDQGLVSLMAHRWFGHGTGLLPTAQDTVSNGRIPALLALPEGAGTLVLSLLTLPYIPSGLTHLVIGPTNALMPIAVAQIDAVVGVTDAAAGVMLVLSLMAGVLWLQRRHDPGFLWMTLACLFWSLRALAYFDASVHIPPLWFEQLNPYSILLTAITLCASMLGNVMQKRPPESAPADGPDWRLWPRRALLFAFVTATALIAASAWSERGVWLARTYAQAWAAGFSLATIWWICSGRFRLPLRHRIAAISAYVVLIGCAIHDMGLVTGHLEPTGPSYLFWGFTLVLVVYALISGDYVIRTLNRAENVNLELERRIHTKSTELENSYRQLRKTEMAGALSSARLQERERLLRDMHDGLGAHLMTALRGVERSALNRDQIAQSLQDGIDELRMMMDSADMGADLSAALAAWRNRWDNRLGAAGVQLHWKLDDALDNIALDGDVLLQIMRILQEAATNVVKHSGARNLLLQATLEALPGQTSLVILVRDDGRGLPAKDTQPHQRGLRNMAHRATLLGASLEVASGEGRKLGCQVRFTLPIDPAPQRPERRKFARP